NTSNADDTFILEPWTVYDLQIATVLIILFYLLINVAGWISRTRRVRLISRLNAPLPPIIESAERKAQIQRKRYELIVEDSIRPRPGFT
ncbi:hypothetical protein PMAYCL1PPCAC_33262, partial [Pristionchus mayeri]